MAAGNVTRLPSGDYDPALLPVAYVGDIMSFYLDYQVNESFLDTASEYNNVLRLARQAGYKFTGPNSTTGMVSVYAVVPANSVGLGPNNDYLPILKRNTTLCRGWLLFW